MKFVPLPKGTFYMGYGGEDGMGGRLARGRKTEINEDFQIAIYTVTQGQWLELMGNNPSYFSRDGGGKDKVKNISEEELKMFPVEGVSWHAAQDFIKKLNEKERGNGWLYRLPTEAEWEYACRGGATTEKECSFLFYFAQPTNDLSSKQANFNGNFPIGKGARGPDLGRTTRVGSYAANKLGLYDMHGNQGQWCQDTFNKGDDRLRVVRGGSWNLLGDRCIAGHRDGSPPTYGLSFRLVRVAVPVKDK
jgi:formylglycine-generating enzyme required for sulfatase activity